MVFSHKVKLLSLSFEYNYLRFSHPMQPVNTHFYYFLLNKMSLFLFFSAFEIPVKSLLYLRIYSCFSFTLFISARLTSFLPEKLCLFSVFVCRWECDRECYMMYHHRLVCGKALIKWPSLCVDGMQDEAIPKRNARVLFFPFGEKPEIHERPTVWTSERDRKNCDRIKDNQCEVHLPHSQVAFTT